MIEPLVDVNNPGRDSRVSYLSEVILMFIWQRTGKRLSPVINQIVYVINHFTLRHVVPVPPGV